MDFQGRRFSAHENFASSCLRFFHFPFWTAPLVLLPTGAMERRPESPRLFLSRFSISAQSCSAAAYPFSLLEFRSGPPNSFPFMGFFFLSPLIFRSHFLSHQGGSLMACHFFFTLSPAPPPTRTSVTLTSAGATLAPFNGFLEIRMKPKSPQFYCSPGRDNPPLGAIFLPSLPRP